MRLYIGRTKIMTYELGSAKKCWRPEKGFFSHALIEIFCEKQFEKLTGLKLAPGEIRKVKSITIELEE